MPSPMADASVQFVITDKWVKRLYKRRTILLQVLAKCWLGMGGVIRLHKYSFIWWFKEGWYHGVGIVWTFTRFHHRRQHPTQKTMPEDWSRDYTKQWTRMLYSKDGLSMITLLGQEKREQKLELGWVIQRTQGVWQAACWVISPLLSSIVRCPPVGRLPLPWRPSALDGWGSSQAAPLVVMISETQIPAERTGMKIICEVSRIIEEMPH